jgi:hypothetical protein
MNEDAKGKKRAQYSSDTKDGKKHKKFKGKKNEGEDRYYKPAEWWALSKEKRDSIIAKRKARGSQTSAVSTETPKENGKQVSSVQTSQRK